jgi:hypothetical protein
MLAGLSSVRPMRHCRLAITVSQCPGDIVYSQ